MVRYWLCVTNEENWEVVKNRKILGVPLRNRHEIAKARPNDVFVFYVKPTRIGGVFRVETEPFESDERIFSTAGFDKGEAFRHRISLKPNVVLKRSIDFREWVPQLKFIIQKNKWGTYLMGKAMRTIS